MLTVELNTIYNMDCFELMKHVMEDARNGNYRITDEPCDTSQAKDENYKNANVYINQWLNGGYTGDDYAGTISIELPNGQYFTYDYEGVQIK